jgi:hypothetical protein
MIRSHPGPGPRGYACAHIWLGIIITIRLHLNSPGLAQGVSDHCLLNLKSNKKQEQQQSKPFEFEIEQETKTTTVELKQRLCNCWCFC